MEEKIYSARNLDEAINDACADLVVTSDRLNYVVIQEATNGFFGIGAKPCKIRVIIKDDDQEQENTDTKEKKFVKPEKKDVNKKEESPHNNELKSEKPAKEKEVQNQQNERKESSKKSERRNDQKKDQKGEQKQKNPKKRPSQDNRQNNEQGGMKQPADIQARSEKNQTREEKKSIDNRSSSDQVGNDNAVSDRKPDQNAASQRGYERIPVSPEAAKEAVDSAESFLTGLFSSMDMKISCRTEFNNETNELIADLSGEDMGVLIGKRGQTLDALQYLTSQVVNKHQNSYIRVKLDTENYRERRKESMETFAQNIALKVKRTKKPVALEPMNPYERRIIHSVLQGDKEIVTRSEGVEPYRHVVICPVRKRKTGFTSAQEQQ